MSTGISWTDETWNPIRGCTPVSAGCTNCYAARQARRFSGPGKAYDGLTRMTASGPKWTGKIRLVPEVLDQPLRWRKPRRIFVNSMSDLFHEDVPSEFIAAVFGVMAGARQHTFQVLTKRPERMAQWFRWVETDVREPRWECLEKAEELIDREPQEDSESTWPLPNVWSGVSVEDQEAANERIPLLLQTPAAVRFLSCEPLLGPLDLDPRKWAPTDTCFQAPPKLDQVIVGGESGPGARPCDVRWIRSIVQQCREAKVACFVKQDSGLRAGERGRIPDDLWIQEMPDAARP